MRKPLLAKSAAADPPPGYRARSPRETFFDGAPGLAFEAIGQAQLLSLATEQALRGLDQQALSRAVDEPQTFFSVEREDRDVNFLHHSPEQGGRFKRSEPLLAQRGAESVDLQHDLAHGVFAACAPGTDGKVTLAQRGKQIRQRLKGVNDALAQGEGAAQPDAHDHEGECPLDLAEVFASPEQEDRNQHTGKAREEGHRRLAYVPLKTRQGLLDQITFNFFEAQIFQSRRGLAPSAQAEIAGAEDLVLGQQDRSLDRVVELPNVSRPGTFEHGLSGGRVEPAQAIPVTLRVLAQEVRRERENVLPALAERRQVNLGGVETKEQGH